MRDPKWRPAIRASLRLQWRRACHPSSARHGLRLDICNHGYDHVVNIATDVILGPDEPGYDYKKFSALLEEIKPYLRRYDRAKVIGKEIASICAAGHSNFAVRATKSSREG